MSWIHANKGICPTRNESDGNVLSMGRYRATENIIGNPRMKIHFFGKDEQ